MLAWILKCVQGTHDTAEAWRPVHTHFDMLIGITGSHMLLLSEVMEMSPFGR